MSESANKDDLGEVVTEVLLPLTTAAQLSVALFGGVISSTGDLTKFFVDLEPTIQKLSVLSEQVKAQKEATMKPVPAKQAVPKKKATKGAV